MSEARHKTIDTSLQIHPQAWAILMLLDSFGVVLPAGLDSNLLDIRTSALYNGRECGVVVTVQDFNRRQGPSKCFHVFFSERRNSDQILVCHWKAEGSINPPAELHESCWSQKKFFDYNQTYPAAEYVRQLVQEFIYTL